MCEFDQSFPTEQSPRLISRRNVALGGLGLAAWSAFPGELLAGSAGLAEGMAEVETEFGKTEVFVVRPSAGLYPAVLLWPDVAGLRPSYQEMARRIAAAGYVVLVPNIYFRVTALPVFEAFADWRTEEGQARFKSMMPLMGQLEIQSISRSLVEFLMKQRFVARKRAVGVIGYCLGGAWALHSAAALPKLVKAVASFHGFGLVNTSPMSPHLQIAKVSANYLFEIARNDDQRDPQQKDALASSGGSNTKIEVIVRQADHGWCTLDGPTYDPVAADLSSARLQQLLAAL
jgi:carboxymethylenebutenolidase